MFGQRFFQFLIFFSATCTCFQWVSIWKICKLYANSREKMIKTPASVTGVTEKLSAIVNNNSTWDYMQLWLTKEVRYPNDQTKKGLKHLIGQSLSTREYWLIYRGPGFLSYVQLGSSTIPATVSKLSFFLSLPVGCWSNLLTGEGERSVGGAKSYDGEKALSCILKSINSRCFIP